MPRHLIHGSLSPTFTRITFHLPSVVMGTFPVQARLTSNSISNALSPSVIEGTFTIASWMSTKSNFIVAGIRIERRIEMMTNCARSRPLIPFVRWAVYTQSSANREPTVWLLGISAYAHILDRKSSGARNGQENFPRPLARHVRGAHRQRGAVPSIRQRCHCDTPLDVLAFRAAHPRSYKFFRITLLCGTSYEQKTKPGGRIGVYSCCEVPKPVCSSIPWSDPAGHERCGLSGRDRCEFRFCSGFFVTSEKTEFRL
jgi:hypothetical protein